MVKLSTSAGSLCRGDTATSLPDPGSQALQRPGRTRGGEMVGREIGVIYCKVVTLARTMCVSLCANINSLFQIPVMSAACSDDHSSARLSADCLPDLPVLGSGHRSVTNNNLDVSHFYKTNKSL